VGGDVIRDLQVVPSSSSSSSSSSAPCIAIAIAIAIATAHLSLLLLLLLLLMHPVFPRGMAPALLSPICCPPSPAPSAPPLVTAVAL
jgi:hypothetical protein